MTRICFTGPHGIGKSESAIKLNKLLPDYLYIPSFAGAVAKRMGFDLNQPHSLDQLIDYQERCLETFIEGYKATAYTDTIFDRSPNDIAAYMATGLGGKFPGHLAAFEKRCLAATIKYCDILVYPEADLTEPMQNKHNRPTSEKYARVDFDKLIDKYAGIVSQDIRVIDVPKEYQYDARVTYIYQQLRVWKKA